MVLFNAQKVMKTWMRIVSMLLIYHCKHPSSTAVIVLKHVLIHFCMVPVARKRDVFDPFIYTKKTRRIPVLVDTIPHSYLSSIIVSVRKTDLLECIWHLGYKRITQPWQEGGRIVLLQCCWENELPYFGMHASIPICTSTDVQYLNWAY